MTRHHLSRVLALGMVVALGAYIWWHRGEFASVVVVSPFYLVLCAFTTVGILASNGILLYAMVNKLGGRIGIWESTNLSIVATGANVLTQSGTVVRALYLKRLHGFAYSQFLATLIGSQVLMGIVCSGFAAIGLAWLALIDQRRGLGPLIGGVTICLGVSLLAFFLPRIRPGDSWFWGRVATVSDSWYRLRKEPKFLATLTALVALQVGSQILSFWTGFLAIGIGVGLPAATAAGSLATLASIPSVTPGAIGIYEAASAFIGLSLDIPPVNSVMASMVSRAVGLVPVLVLAPLATLFLARQNKTPAEARVVSREAPDPPGSVSQPALRQSLPR